MCGNDGLNTRTTSYSGALRCGFDGVVAEVIAPNIRVLEYSLKKTSTAGNAFLLASGNASSPSSCEPWKAYPNSYIQTTTFEDIEHEEQIRWESRWANNAIVFVNHDCEGYYRFIVGEKTKTSGTRSVLTFAAQTDCVAYERKYDGTCYGNQLGQYTLVVFYGAPAPAPGTVTVTDACTGAPAFSYTNTLVSPPLTLSPLRIGDTSITIRVYHKVLLLKESWLAGGFYTTFPGILTPQKEGIFATSSGKEDAFYTWKDYKVFSLGTGQEYPPIGSIFFPVGSK